MTVTRRAFAVAAAVALAGCGSGGDGGGGDGGSASDGTATPSENPAMGDVTQQGDLQLTSPAFEDGSEIPRKYGFREETEIPEGWEPERAVEGVTDFDERGYGGPAPPDEEHIYRFKLYAVGTTLDLPESASKRDVGEAMQGEVLAATQLEGTFAP
jgi:phosphatidylethanolamine-binding protein (PEBP) family uncharacterized protein